MTIYNEGGGTKGGDRHPRRKSGEALPHCRNGLGAQKELPKNVKDRQFFYFLEGMVRGRLLELQSFGMSKPLNLAGIDDLNKFGIY